MQQGCTIYLKMSDHTKFISFHITDNDFKKFIILKNSLQFEKMSSLRQTLIEKEEEILDISKRAKRGKGWCSSGKSDVIEMK